jgi:predicted TIM-barrel fold metal-dependent hydrolase
MMPSRHVLTHVWVSTTPRFSLPPLRCTSQVLGANRVLLTVDFPYSVEAADRAVLDALPLSGAHRAKVVAGNAGALFGLRPARVSHRQQASEPATSSNCPRAAP